MAVYGTRERFRLATKTAPFAEYAMGKPLFNQHKLSLQCHYNTSPKDVKQTAGENNGINFSRKKHVTVQSYFVAGKTLIIVQDVQ
ncbi:hypothetical protein [Agathobaculum sp.]|uniref:hypothetical protein n=1 Tax=Agathobaculum sp. TaxID=2048138 RepID=UPI002A81116E|nr:hypothetical protein [Agathobaculum sp.]MDY3618480.1 hypothetical protein [Agathobaculum sp.]